MQTQTERDAVPTALEGTDRKGIALITALFGIVVLAIMMSGIHFTSTQEFRGTRNALVEQRSFAVAEYGLNSEISNWDRGRNIPEAFPIGTIDSNQVYVASGDTAWVKVTRLTDNTFWVVSDGRASIGNANLEARRQTSAYVRIAYPSITPKGAITAAGDVRLQGSALVDGDDTVPAGWSDCPVTPAATVPAIVVPPTSTVTYNPSNKLSGGNYNSDIEPVGTATTCDKSSDWNWGEPLRPGAVIGCYGYYPIIYASGSLHLNGNGYGQGILLVNGDLEINGKFEFYGLVIVRDDVTKGNGTAKIHGALYAANLTLDTSLSWVTGNQDVYYSKCAVETALAGSAILVRVTQRHWAQVF